MWIGRQKWINTESDRSNWVWMCKCGCWWARGPFFWIRLKEKQKGINSDYQSQFSVFRLWSIQNVEFEQKSILVEHSISRILDFQVVFGTLRSLKVTWTMVTFLYTWNSWFDGLYTCTLVCLNLGLQKIGNFGKFWHFPKHTIS